jgi:hypothetical protein
VQRRQRTLDEISGHYEQRRSDTTFLDGELARTKLEHTTLTKPGANGHAARRELHQDAPESLHTDATLTMEQVPGGWKIAAVHLSLRAKVPGLDAVKFKELAESAKANCPVSKVLNAAITLDAALE